MAGVVAAVEKREELGFEALELRLGLPGDNEATKKRGFEETVDLKLKLPTGLDDVKVEGEKVKIRTTEPEKPPAAKAQVVGWPPVRSSFRKNIMSTQSEKAKKEETDQKPVVASAAFIKVSMDGAPYLRKIDLKMYRSYQELSLALENMFSSFTIGNCGSQGINFMNESKLMDLLNGSEYVPTYEDKDGDWMLVGDVPWQMFVDSCKRLRIMKGSEAIGIAPKAMEKCKNRS